MTELAFTAVIACTPAGVIGKDGGMPWKLSSDLQRFKSLTMGGTLIMGRKTYLTIGKPLPGRETIVLSRSLAPSHDSPLHLHWANTLEQALRLTGELNRPVFVVGGAEIYNLFWPYCDELLLTRVWSDTQGDTMVNLPLEQFDLVATTAYPQTAIDSAATEFQHWRRKISVPKLPCPH